VKFILTIKKNIDTGYDVIPIEFWKILCTVRDGIKILTNMFNKMKNGKEFLLDWKIAIIYPICKGRETDRNEETTEGFHIF
jgi:hypothetical protein